MNIQYTKREKTPKYTIEQQMLATKRRRKIVNPLNNMKSLLAIDDEKYFNFTDDIKEICPKSVRFVGKEKFSKKLLLWIAVYDLGKLDG